MIEWDKEYIEGSPKRGDHVLRYKNKNTGGERIEFRFGPHGVGSALYIKHVDTLKASDMCEILLDAAELQQQILHENGKL